MVSVIVPIYNVEKYISECLYSILRQSYKDLEIICVDDCTQDNSPFIIREFQKIDSRIRLISHSTNRGLGGARNTGIEAARGEFILFVDSDDGIAYDMVEQLVTAIEKDQADVAVCGVLSFYPDGTQIRESAYHYKKYVPSHLELFRCPSDYYALVNMWPSASNKLFRTEIIKKYHCKFPEKILYEDHLFYYKYFSHVKKMTYVRSNLYYYRHGRPGSITSFVTGRENEVFKVISQIDEQLKGFLDDETYVSAIMRISYRLLMERQYLLIPNRSEWARYAQKSYEFLNGRYEFEKLKASIDTWYIDDDFYQYIFDSRARRKIQFKEFVKKAPMAKSVIRKLRGQSQNAEGQSSPINVYYQNNPITNNSDRKYGHQTSPIDNNLVQYYAQRAIRYRIKDLGKWLIGIEAAQFATSHLKNAIAFETGLELWEYIYNSIVPNRCIVCASEEKSAIRIYLSCKYQDQRMFFVDLQGKDSVKRGRILEKESFANSCRELTSLPGKLSLLYIKTCLCDECSWILSKVSQYIDDDTIMVFDDYFNMEGWADGSAKAVETFANQNQLTIHYIGYVDILGQVAMSMSRID